VNNLSAFIYGVIQGFTEFLPISSSGHLALLPHFMQVSDPGVFFDLAMHVGTALAVIIYYRKRVLELVKSVFSLHRKDQKHYFTKNMILATGTSIIGILLLKPLSEMFGRQAGLIGINLFVFGALLCIADQYFKKDRPGNFDSKIQWKFMLVIGFAQALAIFPGVSRSGITMTAALLLGIRKSDGANFSFLLSLPIILMGFCYKLLDLNQTELQLINWAHLLIGIIVSFLVGIACIHYFLKFLNKLPFIYFFIYRTLTAILIWSII
jgi:undecaprenyl-diphosphatase